MSNHFAGEEMYLPWRSGSAAMTGNSVYPPEYGVSLPIVYAVWAAVVLLLYWPCRWFAEWKRRRRDAWLSYF